MVGLICVVCCQYFLYDVGTSTNSWNPSIPVCCGKRTFIHLQEWRVWKLLHFFLRILLLLFLFRMVELSCIEMENKDCDIYGKKKIKRRIGCNLGSYQIRLSLVYVQICLIFTHRIWTNLHSVYHKILCKGFLYQT